MACLTLTHMQWGRERKRKGRRENSVNTKCLQASRQAGGWRLLSEAICYAPAILLFSHLPSYVSIPPFFLPFSLSPSSRVSQHEVSTSAICFRVCMTAYVCAFVRLCVNACVCVSLCVGVGDKAVLQHHCVYKAPVCCLLLLITAQHNVSAQLAMHKILCVCVCVSERRGERNRRGWVQTG